MTIQRALTTVAILLAATAVAHGDDWPTYRHDNRRSGATVETLRLPLKQTWRYDSPSAPVPAWAGPAKWDAYAGMKNPKHMRDFDSVFHVTVAGGRVFFGSSADDAAHCLDAATGKPKWTSHTDGPVRLPPAVAGANVYFGSDDGYAYCVKASDGSPVWKYRAAPGDRVVPSNGKLISLWPCRTGVLVADGKAYFAGSLFPWRKSQLCGVDARTGKDSGTGLFKTTATGHAIQGALLASDSQLFAPQGRSAALVFSRGDGKFAGALGGRGDGGVYALLTKGSQLIYGPGSKTGWLAMQDAKTRTRISAFAGASRIVMGDKTGYIYKPGNLSTFKLAEHITLNRQRALAGKLKALSRPPKSRRGKKETPAQAAKRKAAHEVVKLELEKVASELKRIKQAGGASFNFSVACPLAYEVILAGETMFLGGDSVVHALSARDGKALWEAPVDGKARGLAVAGGRLFVSTDKGKIHCFASATNAKR
ncbi:MAG: PQQ-binding-like beta-propeller repeat protein [Phycisphaerae bacterium]|jgi:outer membrane protein assembly factor BamB|nr:PQQ-binding-like beta-propeller repeat protein [Phycisphaerae bacterium]